MTNEEKKVNAPANETPLEEEQLEQANGGLTETERRSTGSVSNIIKNEQKPPRFAPNITYATDGSEEEAQ